MVDWRSLVTCFSMDVWPPDWIVLVGMGTHRGILIVISTKALAVRVVPESSNVVVDSVCTPREAARTIRVAKEGPVASICWSISFTLVIILSAAGSDTLTSNVIFGVRVTRGKDVCVTVAVYVFSPVYSM